LDPYAVLGLTPDASDEEVEAAYRELAKQLHPDVAFGPAAQVQMAVVNAARDEIRGRDADADAGAGAASTNGHGPATGPARAPGHWLSERIRGALPVEVLRELHDFEDVRVVTRASMWQDPHVVLAVTEKRLVWAPLQSFSPRVHVLRHADVASVRHRVRRPLRRRAVVELVTHGGRKVGFGDLEPDTAALIARNVQDGMG